MYMQIEGKLKVLQQVLWQITISRLLQNEGQIKKKVYKN